MDQTKKMALAAHCASEAHDRGLMITAAQVIAWLDENGYLRETSNAGTKEFYAIMTPDERHAFEWVIEQQTRLPSTVGKMAVTLAKYIERINKNE